MKAPFTYILFFAMLSLTLVSCHEEQQPSLFFELKDINELDLAEVRVEKTVIIDDPDIHFKDIGSRSGVFSDAVDWMKRKTSVGKRIGIYSFGTYLSASINLNELTEKDIVIDQDKKHCTLTLPPIQIKERGRDFDVKVEHERVSIYRTQLTPQEKADAKNKASQLLSEEIEKNGELHQELTQNAKDRAQTYFYALLSSWGFTDITIQFKEKQQ